MNSFFNKLQERDNNLSVKLHDQYDPGFDLLAIKENYDGQFILVDKYRYQPLLINLYRQIDPEYNSKKFISIDSSGKFKRHEQIKAAQSYDLDKFNDFLNYRNINFHNKLFYILVKKFNNNPYFLDLRNKYRDILEYNFNYCEIITNNELIFYIDKYISFNDEFKLDIEKANNITNLNLNYINNVYALGCFILFGDLAFYHKIQNIFWFMAERIELLYYNKQLKKTKPILRDFYNRLSKFVDNIKSKQEIEEILCKIISLTPGINKISIDFNRDISIIHILDKNNNLTERYIELPQDINDRFYKELVECINYTKRSFIEFSWKEGNILELSNYLNKIDSKLKFLISNKLFLKIPISRVKANDFRKVYNELKLYKKIEHIYGENNDFRWRDEEGDEERTIIAIMATGAFGYSKTTTTEIVKKYDLPDNPSVFDHYIDELVGQDQIFRHALENVDLKLFL